MRKAYTFLLVLVLLTGCPRDNSGDALLSVILQDPSHANFVPFDGQYPVSWPKSLVIPGKSHFLNKGVFTEVSRKSGGKQANADGYSSLKSDVFLRELKSELSSASLVYTENSLSVMGHPYTILSIKGSSSDQYRDLIINVYHENFRGGTYFRIILDH